jgi:imidazolonepropionase-like amidohydrolase
MSVPNSQHYGLPQTNLERLGLMRLADGVPQVLLAVREALSTGSVYVKIMGGGGISSSRDPLHTLQYTDAEIQAAVEAASHFDTYVATHVYSAEGIKRALNNGIMSIDHGHFIDEEGFELLAEKGAFLSSNLAALSPELLDHPIYGDASTPTGQKTLQFMEQSTGFVELATRYRPKMVFQTDVVLTPAPENRAARDYSMYLHGEWFGKFEALKAMTSVAGELAALTGLNNPYPARLGVIEEGAYADIILVDGNPLEDLSVLGAQESLFQVAARETETVETIQLVMKDGVIYRNTIN